MTNTPNPPKSPTLLPPRKSVELEDPGAHDLGMGLFPFTLHSNLDMFRQR